MINVYSDNGNNRVKVFLVLDDNGEVISVKMGNRIVPDKQGYQFYIDDYIARQIDKFIITMKNGKPNFELREGETIIEPDEQLEKQREIERLEKRLRELKAE